MKPSTFKEKNKTLLKPPSMTDEECSSLDVYTDGKQCISCWVPSFRERVSILFYGRVWLWVVMGHSQPPVSLLGAKTAFIYPTLWGRFKAFMSRPVRLYRDIDEGGFYKLGLLKGKTSGVLQAYWLLVLPYWYSLKNERFKCRIIRFKKVDGKITVSSSCGDVSMTKDTKEVRDDRR